MPITTGTTTYSEVLVLRWIGRIGRIGRGRLRENTSPRAAGAANPTSPIANY